MKVLVINQHTENFGDDAAGDALIRLLLDVEAVEHVSVVYNGPQGDPVYGSRVTAPKGVRLKDIGLAALAWYFVAPVGVLAPSSPALARLRNEIQASDVVFVAPSGANLGIYRDWQFLIRLLIVIREGGRPIFHWNTVGRSGHKIFDALARSVFRRSHMYVREQASRAFLESIGVPCRVGPDTAFALPAIEAPVRPRTLSIVPSELDSWHPEFKKAPVNDLLLGSIAITTAKFAIEHDLDVEVLPHLRSAGEKAFNSRMVQSLVGAGLDRSRVKERHDIETYDEYDRAIATSRLVVGGRYHSVVLAAKNYRPFVSLSYENKMKEVCRYLGTPELEVDLKMRHSIPQRFTAALEKAYGDGSVPARLRQVVTRELAPQVSEPVGEFTLRRVS